MIRNWQAGVTHGESNGRRYMVDKSVYSNGRAIKFVAKELGGADYISANLYDLRSGPQIYPCKMPLEKVLGFLRDLRIK